MVYRNFGKMNVKYHHWATYLQKNSGDFITYLNLAELVLTKFLSHTLATWQITRSMFSFTFLYSVKCFLLLLLLSVTSTFSVHLFNHLYLYIPSVSFKQLKLQVALLEDQTTESSMHLNDI